MTDPHLHLTDDFLTLMARERQAGLLAEAARRRVARGLRHDPSRTRSRYLRWR